VLMALTGLALIGFLIVHLAGNLTFYADADGTAFDNYAETLGSNPLIPLAELGLIVLFVAHIVLGIRVTAQNRLARKGGYAVRKAHGGRTPGSSTMVVTGLVILLFLALHLFHFRLQKEEGISFAKLMREELSQPLGAGAYLVGMIALGLHVSHAFKSALQTLGLNHPKYTPILDKVSVALAVIVAVGFASFPIFVFFGGKA